jgi:hypothetical protein
MPQRDTIHNPIKQAIIKDSWTITDDPYVISYGERFLFVDLGATEFGSFKADEGQFIGAEKNFKRIAIEIKEFRGQSVIADLEQAIGQYILYRMLLDRVDPEREIYLAITDLTSSWRGTRRIPNASNILEVLHSTSDLSFKTFIYQPEGHLS